MALSDMKYIYGPVPSRRLGQSLGISPIPKKTCNYSCIYCQLGRTDRMTNTRQMFFQVSNIMAEFDDVLKEHLKFDVVTIVGEGEPILYSGLGDLILEIKARIDKPLAVITNGSLLYDPQVQLELSEADIILPTLDAYDEASFRRINRPHRSLHFEEVLGGLKEFSKKYGGQLWIEIMLLKGINDDDATLLKYTDILKQIEYSEVYLNTPVRPPAEAYVLATERERMQRAAQILGAIPIDVLQSQGFHSDIKDDYAAILSIIKRHPMNQHEIRGFLESRGCSEIDAVLGKMQRDPTVTVINYKGYETYRLK